MTADLEINVTTEEVPGGTLLHYVVHTPEGIKKINDPVKFRDRSADRLLRTLEELAQGRRAGGELLVGDEIGQELEKLGHDLFKELFPKELSTIYSRFCGSVETLHVASDEPWIPWELIKPFDAEEGVDDDFLCCQFELTRWLAGKNAPAAALDNVDLGAASVACVVAVEAPGYQRLPRAEAESRFLADLARRHSGVESKVVADARYSEVEELLRLGGHGIVHFVGHSELDSEDPNASRFLLADGRSFRPRDLHGTIELRLRQDRPLVFLNGCQSAGQGYSPTRLGGWISRCLDCDCGAFLGPQWSVGDEASHLFATTFYRALEQDGSVGRAVREARRKVREQWPNNPAWLAYAAYAHPQARLRLGSGPGPQRFPSLSWLPRGGMLFGRKEELRTILRHLENPERHRSLLAIDGLGGVGKTALAAEVVRQVRERGLFERVIWETAKEEVFDGSGTVRLPSGPPVTMERLLTTIARELRFVPHLQRLTTQAEKIFLTRQHLLEKEWLVVVDNLESVRNYRHLVSDLQPLFEHSQALLTCRFSLAELDAVRSLPLRGLEEGDSVDFLRHELRERNPLGELDVDEQGLLEIHAATGGLPLAMKLIVGRLLSTASPLERLLERLRDIEWQDPDNTYSQFYRFIYYDIWQTLSQEATLLLARISVLPAMVGNPIGVLLRIGRQPEKTFYRAMEELLRSNLVERSGSMRDPRYTLHPLTRHFVADLLDDSPESS